MKTKDEIKKLFEKLDENKETMLILHIDENDDFESHVCGDETEIAAGIATIIYEGFGKGAPKGVARLAKAIIDGVSYSLEQPSMGAIMIMMQLIKSIHHNNEKMSKKLTDILDDDEDCETCENNRWCPLPDAITYRKENHIPAPKKGKKNSKCGRKENNDAN